MAHDKKRKVGELRIKNPPETEGDRRRERNQPGYGTKRDRPFPHKKTYMHEALDLKQEKKRRAKEQGERAVESVVRFMTGKPIPPQKKKKKKKKGGKK